MKLIADRYLTQNTRWPTSGRVILAQSAPDSVIVYQAYRPTIGRFAAKHGHFRGGGFGMRRMTWIKPNFLWMMYRSGWGTKEGQEVTLAIRLARSAFDQILATAVHSNFDSRVYSSRDEWKEAVATSNVRLQWDPDHDPSGAALDRRAIQLGLRGPVVEKYAGEWILGIEDISEFVERQRQLVATGNNDQLATPVETVYSVTDAAVARRLGLDHGCP
ncbi:DUF4291 domain-containing protein [Pirellulales bacterium]|nr:DUF4291 domain-containing protein [Pirellulales bacterium]